MFRRTIVVAASAAALAALLAPAALAHNGEVHPPPAAPTSARVGVLIADHGEPPEYNADTYESSGSSSATCSTWGSCRPGCVSSTPAPC